MHPGIVTLDKSQRVKERQGFSWQEKIKYKEYIVILFSKETEEKKKMFRDANAMNQLFGCQCWSMP